MATLPREDLYESTIDRSAALWAGVAGGLASVVLRLLIALLQGQSPWAPVRMMAAPLKGEQVLPPPATLELDIFLAGMAGHFGISILFAIVMVFVVRGMPTGATIAISLVLSLVLYVIMFHVLTPSFPYYAKGRGWIPILMHLVLGLVAGWTYRAWANKPPEPVEA